MEYGSLPYGISYPLTDVFASTLVPAIPGSLRGRAPQRGSRGLAPWPQRSAPPALARKAGERFVGTKGTNGNPWFPSSLRESGNSNDGLSMQLWRRSLSIEDFFTPLVIEGDQEVGAYLAETPL